MLEIILNMSFGIGCAALMAYGVLAACWGAVPEPGDKKTETIIFPIIVD